MLLLLTFLFLCVLLGLVRVRTAARMTAVIAGVAAAVTMLYFLRPAFM